MAWTPISGALPQYQKSDGTLASDYYLKFYKSGTSTPFSMATDDTGGTTLAKCQLNSSGYPTTDGSAEFIPYVDQKYKMALYQNSTDADADTLGSAEWVVDTLPQLETSSSDTWSLYTETPTRTANGVFTVVGDKTTTFTVGTRLRFTDNGNTYYGIVIASAYTTLTTVTCIVTANLTANLTDVYTETTSDAGQTKAIHLDARTYILTANATITAHIKREPGSRLSIASGVTGTFNCFIEQIRETFFTGSGTATGSLTNAWVYPETWGVVADGNGSGTGTDNDDAIIACWTMAHKGAGNYTECDILWGPGTYNIKQLNYKGLDRLSNRGSGILFIATDTTSTYTFIIGNNGTTGSDQTTEVNWHGDFVINTVSGATYTTGYYYNYTTRSNMDGMQIAGDFSRATLEIKDSYSSYIGDSCVFSNSNDGSGGTVYVIKMNESVQNVHISSIRIAGSSDTTDSQVGIWLGGIANTLESCDISAIREGVRFDSARNGTVINCYFEGTLFPVTCGFEQVTVARGVTFLGGYYEVLTNGTAFTLSDSTYGVQGFTLNGGWIKGESGGSARQAFEFGNQAYHVNIQGYDIQNIDTTHTGTFRIGGGLLPQFFGSFNTNTDGTIVADTEMQINGESVTGGVRIMTWEAGGNKGLFIESGSPEGNITADIGSLCINTVGGASTTLYVKESGSGNTGWVAK